MPDKPDLNETDVIDLRNIFSVLKKWRYIIIVITLLAVVTSGLMSYYVIDPVYEARSMLLVTMPAGTQQTSTPSQDDLETTISTMSRLPHMTMNTYVGQLTSDTIYSRTVKHLGLDQQGYTTKNLASMVKAEVAKDSNIILLKVQHTDPRLAADVANALGEEYLEYLSERNQDQMTKSTLFLQDQKRETDLVLAALLETYKEYNSAPRSLDYLQKQLGTVTDDINTHQTSIDTGRMEVQQLEAGVASLRQTLAVTPQTVSFTTQGQNGTSSAEEINPVFVSLSATLTEKEAELAEQRARLEATQIIVNRLKGEMAGLQRELSTKQVEQQQMENEISRLEENQNLLAQKVTQTQIARSIDLGGTSLLVASPALVPAHPVKPNKQLNMAVALVLGLMVAVGLAFVLEFMDNTVKHPEDVYKHLGLPVLGTIPVYKGDERKSKRGLFRGRGK